MASPQKERGYTPVAHEILDEICQYKFNGAQLRIIMKLWRVTYGYHTKAADFALNFIEQSTKLSESTIKKEVALLIKAKVLIVTKKQTKKTARRIRFNKNYEEWIISKSGDDVDQNNEEIFDSEVQDTDPQNSDDEVQDTILLQVQDTVPQSKKSNHSEGQYSTPIKDKRSLKIKTFKDNENLFDKFYSSYPRRISKAAGKKAWDKLAKESDFDPDYVIQNTLNFTATCELLKTEARYIPHPSTYLNQRRYIDYPVIDPEGLAKVKGKKTAFERNKDLLLGGTEVVIDDGERSEIPSFQSFGELPEHGNT